MENILTLFDNLVIERNIFEDSLYNYLINPLIPENFWEPVYISFDYQLKLKLTVSVGECPVCMENQSIFRESMCCKQKLCENCCEKWFKRSVHCPYCYQDSREF